MTEYVNFFVLGQARRGGQLHEKLGNSEFIGSFYTEKIYRFYSVADRFPALFRTSAEDPHSTAVYGELYRINMQVLSDSLLPHEPPELELAILQLQSQQFCVGMTLRNHVLDQKDERLALITETDDWLLYLKKKEHRWQ